MGFGPHIGGTGRRLQARPMRRNSRMALRLASFKAGGKASYGVVTDGGIVDLGKRLTKYPTLLDVFRAGAIGEARAAASGGLDHQVKDVTMLPPIPWPEKIICVG